MELRCNIIENHRIANVTPDALCFARTVVMPDCAASDSQIANRGKSVMNARRSSRWRWCNMTILIAFATMLAVCISPALASALTCDSDICVNTSGWWRDDGVFNASGTPIQAAVDNATAGDVIYVWNGSYTENVNVNKRVTLHGDGAYVVNVSAASADDHVFEVTVNYVNISGFNVTRATGSSKAGFYLTGRQHCNISNNNISGNYFGIYLYSSSDNNTLINNNANSNNNYGIYLKSSSNNTLTNNIVDSNSNTGIYLQSSSNNMLTNNTASNNWYGISLIFLSNFNTLTGNIVSNNEYGIHLSSSSNNTFTNNNVSNNRQRGIFLSSSSNNTIYNNYFNNTYNSFDNEDNIWNTTPIPGINIIGGLWLGGNYWSDYTGNDTDGDDLGDTLIPYNSSGNISSGGDYHPLVTPCFVAPNITSYAPESSVNDTYCTWRTFNVYVDQTVNVTWYLNGTPQIPENESVTEANYTFHAEYIGEHNVSALAKNANGTDMETWIWNVTATAQTLNCTCGDICVNETGWWRSGGMFNANATTPIQVAVDNATAGDVIYVWNGSYTENVNVNKRVTLHGEGADVVNVSAASEDDHVFEVAVNYVNISGFNVTGATGSGGFGEAGIFIGRGVGYCNISDNNASGNYIGIYLEYSSNNNTLANNNVDWNLYGIFLSSSSNNTLMNTTVSNNSMGGIFLLSSSNNTLANNNAGSNLFGIFLSSSSNNTLINNNAGSNLFGIFLSSSSNNTIYYNYFNNTYNAYDNGNNIWNTTLTEGTNIIGGSWLGGNYWSDYTGNDTNGDDLGDTLIPYNSSGKISRGGDYHPLVTPGFKAPNITSYAPESPVNTTYCTWRTFNVSVDQIVNVTWYLNGTLQTHKNESVTEANYTFYAEYIGEHNVSALAKNANGTDMETWIWNVTATAQTLNCTCGDICVNETGWWRSGGMFNANATTPIQVAVDNATAGDVIYVWNGSYTENVNVNKRVTLHGEGADVVNVSAASEDDHVFEVTVNYVNISGFNVTGATGSGGHGKAGIYLNLRSVGHCNISDNNVSGNYIGIYLPSTNAYNTLTNNTVNSNSNHGISMGFSSNYNTLANNTISNNSDYGIYLEYSSNNMIYNNYFNNTNNSFDNENNIWNTTLISGTNIIGGSWLGGNYWSDYTGNDTNRDDLGDTLIPYNSSGKISRGGDYHPLVTPCFVAPNITSYAPGSPVNNTYCTWRTFNISVDQTVNVTWYLNGTLQAPKNESVTEANYTFYAEYIGEHNVSALAKNANGTDMETWIWNVTATAQTLNCTCGDICVNETGWWRSGGMFNANATTPIQVAVDNATAGDVIHVWNGSYTENVNVNKQVTLHGEGADVVNVSAASEDDHVFEVTVNYVNISGFNVTGSTGSGGHGKAGIYLNLRSVGHCNISDNNASGNYIGIYLPSTNAYNTITNNTVNLNSNRGISLGFSSNYNILTNNTVNSNSDYGIYLEYSCNNQIYNNYFNNTNNSFDNENNIWNTTPIPGTNIIGGSWLGGNYWSDYTGNDTNGDDLGDTLIPYNSSGKISSGGDYHPLVIPETSTRHG